MGARSPPQGDMGGGSPPQGDMGGGSPPCRGFQGVAPLGQQSRDASGRARGAAVPVPGRPRAGCRVPLADPARRTARGLC